MQYSGYIFDCDGTLADTMPLHHQTWLATLRKYGFTHDLPWELFISLGGLGIEETVDFFNQKYGYQLPALPIALEKEALYRKSMDHIQAKPEILAIAKKAHQQGIPISIASGSPTETVLKTLDIIGCRALFAITICRDNVTHGKPHPESFLKAAQHMGVPPQECVVYEDSPLGKQAADDAGMDCVLIPT